MIKTLRNRFSACILAAVTVLAAIPAVPVHAESGTVYSCTINRSYSNPVTGEIEDAGGNRKWGVGVDTDIIVASIKAVMSALNRASLG